MFNGQMVKTTFLFCFLLLVGCDDGSVYQQAMNHPERPEKDLVKDESRKPELILPFAKIIPGAKVLEMGAGAGHTTELVARVVGATGKVYAQALLPERVVDDRLPNVVPLRSHLMFELADVLTEQSVKPGDLDVVIIFFALHDMYLNSRIDKGALFADFKRFLRPGGHLIILDNRAEPGSGLKNTRKSHRIDESFVKQEIENAGFQFDGASNVLRNLEDDLSQPWQLGDGFHDRFALRFVSPTN